MLQQLSHNNVAELLDVFLGRQQMVLVFEYLEEDLWMYMRRCGALSCSDVKLLSEQLCRGVGYCHENRVLHRDLWPRSILVDAQRRLKITDFRAATYFKVPTQRYPRDDGSTSWLWYRPVEILLGARKYSVSADMWSVGCIFGEMASGSVLFKDDSEIHTLFTIFQQLGTPTAARLRGVEQLPNFKPTFPRWLPKGWENFPQIKEQLGAEGVDLLERLLRYDPGARISAQAALQHGFFVDAERFQEPEA